MKAAVGLGPISSFGLVAWEFKKFLFLFSGLVWIVSNFENLYLSAQSSINYETSSFGLVIL
jgi:hypothetical protein